MLKVRNESSVAAKEIRKINLSTFMGILVIMIQLLSPVVSASGVSISKKSIFQLNIYLDVLMKIYMAKRNESIMVYSFVMKYAIDVNEKVDSFEAGV